MPDQVVIVGVGLIGTSIGIALTDSGYSVSLRDDNESHALVAASLGGGEQRIPRPADVDLVVVATPPDVIAPLVIDSLLRYPAAVVTDVGSVKEPIIQAVLVGCPEHSHRYVPSHPMAGSQFSGPLTASGKLFVDRSWIITPLPTNSAESISVIQRMIRSCAANPITMTARAHDQAVAQVSHVPHLMSILTAARLRSAPSANLRLAGQGVRDVTRIAGSDTALWSQIISANAWAIRQELESVFSDLTRLLRILDDPKELKGFLCTGRAGVQALLAKHGSDPLAVVQVIVEIPDAPNVLAKLFSDIGKAGFNVEDFNLEHDPVREIGYLAIVVERSRGEELRANLVSHGWGAVALVERQ